MAEKPDYNKLIDQEVWAFIKRTEQFYPADAADRPLVELREMYVALCSSFSEGRPAGIQASDQLIQGQEHDVPVRRYSMTDQPLKALVVYMHGGGYVLGGLDSHDDVCAEICAATGFAVTSIDYRLAPEHKHPAAFDDCLMIAVSEAARVAGKPMLLCGDSAGANLSAAVSHALRSSNIAQQPCGQVLIYPELGGDINTGSYVNHADAPMLTTDEIKHFMNARFDGAVPIGDVTSAPLCDSDFSGLPPTIVFSAQCDPLCDDGKHYCNALEKAGGQALWINEPGLVHGYLRARHSTTRGAESFSAIVNALIDLAVKPEDII